MDVHIHKNKYTYINNIKHTPYVQYDRIGYVKNLLYVWNCHFKLPHLVWKQ